MSQIIFLGVLLSLVGENPAAELTPPPIVSPVDEEEQKLSSPE